MSDIAMLHRQALDATRRLIAGVGPEQWGQASPCEDWDVRALVNHIVSGNYWAGELSGGKTIEEVGDRLDGDLLGNDPLHAYDKSADIAADAFSKPGAMESMCAVSYGPVPGSVYATHRFVDILIHGWDIASATGQSTTLDPALVDACTAAVTPEIDMLQASGMFGTTLSTSEGAGPQARLLAMLGRRD